MQSLFARLLALFGAIGAAASLATASLAAPLPFSSFAKRPKLVLVIVVDQFRADYLVRFQKRFGEGGYNELLRKGAYYPMAHYSVLQSMTGPGHAMILTGSLPYQNGIAINYWNQDGKPLYCTADPGVALVGVGTPGEPGSPDSKAGKFAKGGVGNGMSPRNLIGTTVGDELKNAGYPTRVFSVALKDRAAILLGGHRADLALWFDCESFRWISSTHYLKDGKLPAWIEALNRDLEGHKGQTYEWKSPGTATGFTLGAEGPFLRKTVYGGKESLAYPLGLELTVDAAERMLKENGLGRGKGTDFLALSLSSHDYMAHAYGPNTRELEEMTVAEDRLIARLLSTVGKQVGMKDVVIAFTADHGGPPSPAGLKGSGLAAGTIDTDAVGKSIEARLTEKWGKPGDGRKWIADEGDLNFWLSQPVLAEKKLEASAVENEVKAELLKNEGVAFAFSRSDYVARKLPPGMLERQILHGYFLGRSGDVIAIPKPFYFEAGDPVGHMTGYSYDRTVPLILMGARIKAGVYSEDADIIDLAPTLSYLLGTIPPALSEGRVLSEALGAPASK